MSYRLKGSENRSQTTKRNKESPKRKNIRSEAKNWLCQADSSTSSRGMEFQEQSIGAVKLKTQYHSESGLIAMGPPPSKIWTLKGKIVSQWMERNFTPKDQKWGQKLGLQF